MLNCEERVEVFRDGLGLKAFIIQLFDNYLVSRPVKGNEFAYFKCVLRLGIIISRFGSFISGLLILNPIVL